MQPLKFLLILKSNNKNKGMQKLSNTHWETMLNSDQPVFYFSELGTTFRMYA